MPTPIPAGPQTRPILITGATGQVGAALRALFPNAVCPGRAELDLTRPDSIRRAIRNYNPAWILNPAAYTAVDQAETEPVLAQTINADAPGILGEEARAVGAAVVHFSTDYVFPGTGSMPWQESDATGPLNVYGRTKLAGEQALAASGAAHLILRTSWVYAAMGRNFLLTVLRVTRQLAGSGKSMRIVDDQHGAPTAAVELARLARHLLGHFQFDPRQVELANGVYHATAAGETTWFGFAEQALRLARLKYPACAFAEIEPIPSAAYPTPAARPMNSRLDGTRLIRTFGYTPAPWQQTLAEVLESVTL